MKTKKIKVHALLLDGQDGGWSVMLYPSKAEMLKDQKEMAKDRDTELDLTNEHEFGYHAHSPAVIELDENGKMVGAVSLGFGQ